MRFYFNEYRSLMDFEPPDEMGIERKEGRKTILSALLQELIT